MFLWRGVSGLPLDQFHPQASQNKKPPSLHLYPLPDPDISPTIIPVQLSAGFQPFLVLYQSPRDVTSLYTPSGAQWHTSKAKAMTSPLDHFSSFRADSVQQRFPSFAHVRFMPAFVAEPQPLALAGGGSTCLPMFLGSPTRHLETPASPNGEASITQPSSAGKARRKPRHGPVLHPKKHPQSKLVADYPLTVVSARVRGPAASARPPGCPCRLSLGRVLHHGPSVHVPCISFFPNAFDRCI